MVTAIGDLHGGWGLYVLEGRPVAAFSLLDVKTRIASEQVLTPGPHTLELVYHRAKGERPAEGEILVDGTSVAREPVPGLMFLPNLSSSAAGMLVGRDRGFGLTHDYTPPFAFTGTLHRVELRSGRPPTHADDVARVTAAVAGD